MKDLNKQLKLSLSERLNRQHEENPKICPEDGLLADYMSGGLHIEQRSVLDGHIAQCKVCLEKISLASAADELYSAGRLQAEKTPAAIKTLKAFGKLKRASFRRAAAAGFLKQAWLIAALLAFALSFVFPRYFIQCLVLTVIFGIKWVLESETVRVLVLALDSWRRQGDDGHKKDSRRLTGSNSRGIS